MLLFPMFMSLHRPPLRRLFALIIGINDYKSPKIPNLLAAVPNTDAVRDYLQKHLGVPSSQITNIRGNEATRNVTVCDRTSLLYL